MHKTTVTSSHPHSCAMETVTTSSSSVPGQRDVSWPIGESSRQNATKLQDFWEGRPRWACTSRPFEGRCGLIIVVKRSKKNV